MATSMVKIRALTDQGTQMEYDMVVIENRQRAERYPFKFSPLGTADADVYATEIDDNLVAEFSAAVIAKVGVTIRQNPEHADVSTDDGTDGDLTPGDGINEGTRYNWAEYGNLYEIVA